MGGEGTLAVIGLGEIEKRLTGSWGTFGPIAREKAWDPVPSTAKESGAGKNYGILLLA